MRRNFLTYFMIPSSIQCSFSINTNSNTKKYIAPPCSNAVFQASQHVSTAPSTVSASISSPAVSCDSDVSSSATVPVPPKHTNGIPVPTTLTISYVSSSTPSELTRPLPTPPPKLEIRQNTWRESYQSSYDLEGCRPVVLQPGTFFIGATTIVVPPEASTLPVFQPQCINGRPAVGSVPIPDSRPGVVEKQSDTWKDWLDDGGQFAGSAVPLMYSIGASSATCWLLALIVLGFQRKRPLIYKVSLICSSIYLLIVLILVTDTFKDQFENGYLDAIEIRHALRSNTNLNAVNLAFNTLVYLAQVQTAMSLFNRQKEKRMVLWLGGSLTIISQTIWGISIFHPASVLNSLPALAYLFQIALGVLYTCCVVYYVITNRQSTLQPTMLLLTFLAVMAAASPIIFFIVDLANVWIIEWTDAIGWATSMLSIVTVYEWADRVYRSQRHHEKNGVLGKQVFEDEMDTPLNGIPKSHHNDSTQNFKPKFNPPPSTGSSPSISSGEAHTSTSPQQEFGSNLSGSTYGVQQQSSQEQSSLPHSQQVTVPLANITHAVIDSPFDIYADKSVLVKYLHKAVGPIVYISDAIINFGMSVSPPLTSSSLPTSPLPPDAAEPIITTNSHLSNNSSNILTPQETRITSHETSAIQFSSLPSQGSQNLPLQKFFYPQKKNNHE